MSIPNQWYYVKNNERCGPVEPVRLKQLADAGEIRRDSLVWRAGMADWVEAEQVRGLFPEPEQPGKPNLVAEPQSTPVSSISPLRPQETPAAITPIFDTSTTATSTGKPSAAATQSAKTKEPAKLIQPEPRIAVTPKKSSGLIHPMQKLLDALHAKKTASFVEASIGLFTKIGFWAILAYVAILFLGSLIAAVQLGTPRFLGTEIGACILILILQYPAVKMLDLLGQWKFEAKVPRPFFDLIAVIAVLAGVATLVFLTVRAFEIGSITDRIIVPYIFSGIAAFAVLIHLATVAISFPSQDIPSSGDSEETDHPIADLAYSLFGGLWTLVLKTVPVAFGVGISLCGLNLLYSMISLRSQAESVIFTTTAATEALQMFGILLLPAATYLISTALRVLGQFLLRE